MSESKSTDTGGGAAVNLREALESALAALPNTPCACAGDNWCKRCTALDKVREALAAPADAPKCNCGEYTFSHPEAYKMEAKDEMHTRHPGESCEPLGKSAPVAGQVAYVPLQPGEKILPGDIEFWPGGSTGISRHIGEIYSPHEEVMHLHFRPITIPQPAPVGDERKRLLDIIDTAWGIIANAGAGNWQRESKEWQEAAARWRDSIMPEVSAYQQARAALDRSGGWIAENSWLLDKAVCLLLGDSDKEWPGRATCYKVLEYLKPFLPPPPATGDAKTEGCSVSPEAQRIAIAEACGWKCTEHVGGIGSHYGPEPSYLWKSPTGELVGEGFDYCLPDYLADLNAMHEAEKTLNKEQCYTFQRWMEELAGEWKGADGPSNWLWHMTAAQRAEAFLRTIGKWDDQPRQSPPGEAVCKTCDGKGGWEGKTSRGADVFAECPDCTAPAPQPAPEVPSQQSPSPPSR